MATMSSTRSRRDLLINVSLAAGSIMLLALAGELALRFVLPNRNPFERNAEIGYRLKRSFEGTYPWVPVRTDAAGRRVPADFAGVAGGRYLFVGDSVTFGFGVLAEESFPVRFGELVGRPGEVANAAVPGYNLEQVLAVLGDNLARQRPELIVYGLVVNDLYGADSPLGYEDIDPHANRMQAGGLLSRSLLIAFIQRRWTRLARRFGDPEPARSGSAVLDFDQELDRATVQAFDRQWAALESIGTTTGIPVVVVVLPFRRQVEQLGTPRALQRFVQARCVDSPIRCLDPIEVLRVQLGDGLFNGTSSFHFNPRGHGIIAAWLIEQLEMDAQ